MQVKSSSLSKESEKHRRAKESFWRYVKEGNFKFQHSGTVVDFSKLQVVDAKLELPIYTDCIYPTYGFCNHNDCYGESCKAKETGNYQHCFDCVRNFHGNRSYRVNMFQPDVSLINSSGHLIVGCEFVKTSDISSKTADLYSKHPTVVAMFKWYEDKFFLIEKSIKSGDPIIVQYATMYQPFWSNWKDLEESVKNDVR